MLKKVFFAILFFAVFFLLRSYWSYRNHKTNPQIEAEWRETQDSLSSNIITPQAIFDEHQQKKSKQAALTDQSIWKQLTAVKYETKADGYVPFFDNRQTALDKQTIIIEGYMVQTETKTASNYFLLSLYPYQSCFFCGGAGIETMIEVESKKPIPFTDKPIKLQGILQLNRQTEAAFFYTLQETVSF